MFFSTEGIVLNNTPYGEADLIVTYLTKDFGLTNLFAKSPRKIKSRFGSSLEPLTYSKITFIGREEKLQRIIQSQILHPFHELREDLKIFINFAEVLKLIIKFTPERLPVQDLFSLLLDTLFILQKTNKINNHILSLKLKTLKILGYLPEIFLCGICKTKIEKEIIYSKGFIICQKCKNSYLQNNSDVRIISLSEGAIALLRGLITWQIPFLERVKISEKLSEEINLFINTHVETILGYNN